MKNVGRSTTPTSRSGLRQDELSSRNVGRDLSSTPDRNSTAKGTFLQQHATRTPTDSPMARLATVAPKDLLAKVDAPNAGDHSLQFQL